MVVFQILHFSMGCWGPRGTGHLYIFSPPLKWRSNGPTLARRSRATAWSPACCRRPWPRSRRCPVVHGEVSGRKNAPKVDEKWYTLTRWWQLQMFFLFSHWGRWTHVDEHMFQRGSCWNHQPVLVGIRFVLGLFLATQKKIGIVINHEIRIRFQTTQ